CILYVASGLAVLAVHASQIPAMLALIVHSAFGQTEASGAFLGGAAGLAFSVGLRRALFSNEAGLGSAPIAHAAAKTAQPAREGIVGGIGPFVDTICICTLTALVIIATGIWNRGPQGQMKGPVGLIELDGATHLVAPTEVAALPELPAWDRWQPGSQVFFLVTVPSEQEPGRRHRSRIMGRIVAADGAAGSRIEWDQPPPGARWVLRPDGTPQTGLFRDFKGATLTSHAFDRVFPGLGKWLVTTAAWLFAISTMISWSYYGEQGIVYMLGSKGVVPYKLVFLSLTIMAPAAVATDRQLGDLADFGTGWMLWANMLIVLMMGYRAVRCLADYLERLRAGQFAVRAGRRRTGPADGKNTP
ncbi:MAG: alanine:cation symporter family protein, partial [Phycisphaerae bacterium]